MPCERHRGRFSGYWPFREHLLATSNGVMASGDGCLSCQAESVRQQRINRSMEQLRNTYLDPGPNLLSTLLANGPNSVINLDRSKPRGGQATLNQARRWPYLVAISGAVAVVGVVATMVRRPRLVS